MNDDLIDYAIPISIIHAAELYNRLDDLEKKVAKIGYLLDAINNHLGMIELNTIRREEIEKMYGRLEILEIDRDDSR